mgnify:CR=1 FL=1|jgi:hypothetical protein
MSFRDKTSKLLDSAFSVFGEKNKIQYRPKSGGTFTIRGIFDETWEEVDPETFAVVSSTQPNVGIKSSELDFTPESGDEVEIMNILYRVIDIQEDGQGADTLFLHKVE